MADAKKVGEFLFESIEDFRSARRAIETSIGLKGIDFGHWFGDRIYIYSDCEDLTLAIQLCKAHKGQDRL